MPPPARDAIRDLAELSTTLAAPWLPHPALTALQLRRFRALVRHAYRRSRYYRELMDRHGIDPDRPELDRFPPLTKDVFIERFDDLSTREEVRQDGLLRFLASSRDPTELYLGAYVVVHSSGTTGRTCVQAYRLDEWRHGALPILRLLPQRWRRRLAYLGAVDGHYMGAAVATTPRLSGPGRQDATTLLNVNAPRRETLAALEASRPLALVSYPSVLRELAEARRLGSLRFAPEVLVSTGETLAPQVRAEIEAAFERPLLELYAATETQCLALGHRSGCLTLCEDRSIAEIHDDHLLVTNLTSRTVPVIRYRLDDVVQPYRGADRGARIGPRRIASVIGREEHPLRLRNDEGVVDALHPSVFVEFHVQGLLGLQVRKTGAATFEALALLDPRLGPDGKERTKKRVEDRLRRLLAQKAMTRVRFAVREIDRVERTASGKVRVVL